MSTEEMLNTLTKNMIQFQDETRSSIKNIERQMGQISGAISNLEARDSEKLPSQTEPNPRMNASAMTLRNGIELQEAQAPLSQEEKNVTTAPLPQYKVVTPFSEALKERRKHEADKDIYEVFKKCEVNIPLLDALKRIPRYAKFLKELYTAKRKQRLKGIQKVKMSEHISAIFQRKLPPKCGDPGMFTVPCIIGELTSQKAMLDLGASINVIPYSLYKSLKLGTLHETSVVIQLANCSDTLIVEDVLVEVGNLIFPADFYVSDMEHDKYAAPILLGRPFMKTAKTKIDVDT
ncbi:uncharacterized protein LOC130824921 [Amaranthus tricolor]|uniref:uncharacterized protein LOC130824921 n=1 Tax=Amaranthus tricolor TaxID=29722 RepID=UPI00258F1B63|nr:uncharacterized protein LOC130824921 [Amaranthus tricolor]